MEEALPDADYIVFGSASGVRAFCESAAIPEETTAVCIGDYTANELKKYPACRMVTAKTFTAEGIVQAIADDLDAQK